MRYTRMVAPVSPHLYESRAIITRCTTWKRCRNKCPRNGRRLGKPARWLTSDPENVLRRAAFQARREKYVAASFPPGHRRVSLSFRCSFVIHNNCPAYPVVLSAGHLLFRVLFKRIYKDFRENSDRKRMIRRSANCLRRNRHRLQHLICYREATLTMIKEDWFPCFGF